MKLTNEEIVKVFINHIFCSAIYKKSNAIFEITGLTWMFNQYHLLTNPNCNMGYSVAECQLLLTPLSAISDEDAICIGEMVGCWSKKDLHGEDGCFQDVKDVLLLKGKLFVSIMFNLSLGIGAFPTVEGIKANDFYFVREYLISKGYDVPLFFGIDHWANGKTAIELGIAIDKTKI